MSRLLFLEPTDERWLALLGRPQACNFHHPDWIALLRAAYGYRAFVAAMPDGAGGVSAGLPIMEVNSVLTGRRWAALPFSDHCCPLAADDTALGALVDELVGRYASGEAPRIEVRASLAHEAARHQSTCLLHTVTLADDEEATWGRVEAKHRRNTRHAEKQGVEVVQRDDLEALRAFYRLHTLTRRRQGVPVQPWRFFARLAGLLAKGQGFVLLATKEGVCVAGAVLLRWGQTLMLKYAASDPRYLRYCPNNLIYAHAIRWACRNGCRRLDMGKTDETNDGLRAFKRGWGADEQPLVYSYIGDARGHEVGSSLAGVAGSVIRRAPTWLCRASGELFYRHLG